MTQTLRQQTGASEGNKSSCKHALCSVTLGSVMEELGFGVQVEIGGERWAKLQQCLEELHAWESIVRGADDEDADDEDAGDDVSGGYQRRVRISLGQPAEIVEGEEVLVVESDVQRWAAAMQKGVAVLVDPTVATWRQAKVVREVAILLAYPQQRQLLLGSLMLRRPWERASGQVAVALQLTLAALAARSGLAKQALQYLVETGCSEPELGQRTSLAASREEGVSLERCLGAVQSFATSAKAGLVGQARASDKELMRWFCEKGEREAFRELLRRYGRVIYRFAFRVVADEAAAAKICDDVVSEAFETAQACQPQVSPKAWFLSLATERAKEVIGRGAWRVRYRPLPNHMQFLSKIDATLGNDPYAMGLRRLERVLSLMSPESRAVTLMHSQHNLSLEELALATDRSLASINVAQARAWPMLGEIQRAQERWLLFKALQ